MFLQKGIEFLRTIQNKLAYPKRYMNYIWNHVKVIENITESWQYLVFFLITDPSLFKNQFDVQFVASLFIVFSLLGPDSLCAWNSETLCQC